MYVLMLSTYYSMDREWDSRPVAVSMNERSLETFMKNYPVSDNQKLHIVKTTLVV